MAIRDKVRAWYVGEYVPFENDPDSPIVFVGGYFERHWSARLVSTFVYFWRFHWKWCLGFLVSVAALVVAYVSL